MKLYNGYSPNGFRVAVFMHEKGIELPVHDINVMEREARSAEHLKRNSLGEIPVLELDDGSFLSESVAICRYLESQFPDKPLMGSTPQEIAHIEMWNRRMEQQVMGCVGSYGMHVIPVFADKVEQMPEYADSQKRQFARNLAWLDSELSDGRAYIAGAEFTIADITGMAALMICGFLDGLSLPDDLAHVQRWANSVQSRASAKVFEA